MCHRKNETDSMTIFYTIPGIISKLPYNFQIRILWVFFNDFDISLLT